MERRDTVDEAALAKWKGLLRLGGWSGLIVAALLMSEMILYIASAPPSLADAEGWLALFQNNRLLALIDFGLLEFWALALFVPFLLALYVVLRRTNESSMTAGVVLAAMGIGINYATNQLFPLLAISGLHEAATGVERAQFLAAAQVALAQAAQGGIAGGVQGGTPLALGGLVISAVMLGSRAFSRGEAYMGLLANAAGLMMYISAAFVTSLEGSPFFGPFLLLSFLWFGLVGRRLLQLVR